jgi:2,3-bisphosphoglycerate-dependent phosphoglycerate mutase
MSLIVMRHGETLFNKMGVLAGWTNVPLSNLGKQQVFRTIPVLKSVNIQKIFTSDQQRSIETANIIKKELQKDIPIISSEALKERHYGILTGKPKSELNNLYSPQTVQSWRRGYYDRPPYGENLHDVKMRVSNFYEANIIHCFDNQQNILVVSHSNTLRALFVHLKLKDENTIEKFDINNCQIIKIDWKNCKFSYLMV